MKNCSNCPLHWTLNINNSYYPNAGCYTGRIKSEVLEKIICKSPQSIKKVVRKILFKIAFLEYRNTARRAKRKLKSDVRKMVKKYGIYNKRSRT